MYLFRNERDSHPIFMVLPHWLVVNDFASACVTSLNRFKLEINIFPLRARRGLEIDGWLSAHRWGKGQMCPVRVFRSVPADDRAAIAHEQGIADFLGLGEWSGRAELAINSHDSAGLPVARQVVGDEIKVCQLAVVQVRPYAHLVGHVVVIIRQLAVLVQCADMLRSDGQIERFLRVLQSAATT